MKITGLIPIQNKLNFTNVCAEEKHILDYLGYTTVFK